MSENLASMSIRNLMNEAQRSIRGMNDISSTRLTHLTSELNAILDEVNQNPDTKIAKNLFGQEVIVKENNFEFKEFFGSDSSSSSDEDEIDIDKLFDSDSDSSKSDKSSEENDNIGRGDVCIDTWKKFNYYFGSELKNRGQKFVQEVVEELTKMRENIKKLNRTSDCFREAFMIIKSRFDINILPFDIWNTIEALEKQASDVQMILEEMEKTLKVFPKDYSY